MVSFSYEEAKEATGRQGPQRGLARRAFAALQHEPPGSLRQGLQARQGRRKGERLVTTVLDTPEQIQMWVLLSRRAQLKLQAKGLPTKGLIKWCKANIEGCESARTWRDCVVPVESAIAMAGGPQDYSIVNVHVMVKRGGLFIDRGIFADMAEVEARPDFVNLYNEGSLEIVYTLDEPRAANNEIFVPA